MREARLLHLLVQWRNLRRCHKLRTTLRCTNFDNLPLRNDNLAHVFDDRFVLVRKILLVRKSQRTEGEGQDGGLRSTGIQ